MSIRPEGRLRAGALLLACVAGSMLAACGREAAKPAPAAAVMRDPMHVKADAELLKRLQVVPAARAEIQEKPPGQAQRGRRAPPGHWEQVRRERQVRQERQAPPAAQEPPVRRVQPVLWEPVQREPQDPREPQEPPV